MSCIGFLEGVEMLLELQKRIIYGPIRSRRLGQSLGINILPAGKKVCPFNCIYCQYGWTKVHTAKGMRHLFPTVEVIRDALTKALKDLQIPPSYITFSGNGEPTLQPQFGQIVETVISVRNRMAKEAKTAILSNSALVEKNSICKALEKLDVRIMKLDCGSPRMFKKYNQPCPGIDLELITEGLSRLSDINIQTLLSSGEAGNIQPKNIKDWIERLKRIRPLTVQLYTMDRDYPSKNLKPASRNELEGIRELVEDAGISAQVF